MKRFLLCLMFCTAGIASCHAGNVVGGAGTAWIPGTPVATSPYFPSVIPTDGLVAAYRKGDWVVESGKVSLWRDSINDYDATQTTALRQPGLGITGELFFGADSRSSGLIIPANAFASCSANGKLTYVFRMRTEGNILDYVVPMSGISTFETCLYYGAALWYLRTDTSNTYDVSFANAPISSTTTSLFVIEILVGTGARYITQTNIATQLNATVVCPTTEKIVGAFYDFSTVANLVVSDLWIYNRPLTDSDIEIFRSLP